MTGDTAPLVRAIADAAAGGGPIRLMEVCGTHTVAIFRAGLKAMLPANLRLVSGPGCPVCVTAQGYLDAACALAARPGVTVATYGDMVRVPGREESLAAVRAKGGRIQVVYSARDAVAYAVRHPGEQVVFLAVGFETTTPATAVAVLEAEAQNLDNFTVLPAHKQVVPAMLALLAAGEVPLDGILCPGHVSVIIGTEAYRPLVERHGKGCVVTGFEPASMLKGILRLVEMVRDRRPGLDNAYRNVVRPEGNPAARAVIDRVFATGDAVWRALGRIPGSGLVLREAYRRFDAGARFGVDAEADYEMPGCRCGSVIQGKIDPPECGLFGKACTPTAPVGPCMVSSEGTCAAWFKYARLAKAKT